MLKKILAISIVCVLTILPLTGCTTIYENIFGNKSELDDTINDEVFLPNKDDDSTIIQESDELNVYYEEENEYEKEAVEILTPMLKDGIEMLDNAGWETQLFIDDETFIIQISMEQEILDTFSEEDFQLLIEAWKPCTEALKRVLESKGNPLSVGFIVSTPGQEYFYVVIVDGEYLPDEH